MTASVGIALYNGSKYIIDQLESIRRQSRQPDEVILMDDCSTDDTYSLVNSYINAYSLLNRWKLLRNDHNEGYIHNFNRIIMASDCDAVFLCDQDDIWHEKKIEIMMQILEDNDGINLLSSSYTENINVFENLVQTNSDGCIKKIDVKKALTHWKWPGMCMCVRSAWIKTYGEKIILSKSPHDMTLAMLAADRESFYEMKYIGAYHRLHSDNTSPSEKKWIRLAGREYKTTNYSAQINEYYELLEIFKDTFQKNTVDLIRNKIDFLKHRIAILGRRKPIEVCGYYLKRGNVYAKASSFASDLASCFWD